MVIEYCVKANLGCQFEPLIYKVFRWVGINLLLNQAWATSLLAANAWIDRGSKNQCPPDGNQVI